MKITRQQLKQIIREESLKNKQQKDFGSNAARQEALNEQAEIPEVEVTDEGGTLIISAEDAAEVEAVIAQAFGVIDDLILAIEGT